MHYLYTIPYCISALYMILYNHQGKQKSRLQSSKTNNRHPTKK
nr:MAG TPA: hypothetical protein [Caudoviricetes sp.]